MGGNQRFAFPIDNFNKNIIKRVIGEVKNEHESLGISSMTAGNGMNNLYGDDQGNNTGLGGLINEEEVSVTDKLKQL